MLKSEKARLIAINSFVWVCLILVSFVLPLMFDSLNEGRGKFLQVLAQVGPLFAGVLVSTAMLNSGIPESEPTETDP